MTNTTARAAFNAAELKERAILTQIFDKKNIKDYEFTAIGSCERYDFKFTIGDRIFFGDVKNRAIKSTTYKDSLIDKSKIDYLIGTGELNGWIPMIVATYTDDVALTWYLLKEAQSWKVDTKYCNRTTAINTGKKEKEVILLLTANATKTTIND